MNRVIQIGLGVALLAFIYAQGYGKSPYPTLGNYVLIGTFVVGSGLLVKEIFHQMRTGIAYGFTKFGTSRVGVDKNINPERYHTTIILNWLWPTMCLVVAGAIALAMW